MIKTSLYRSLLVMTVLLVLVGVRLYADDGEAQEVEAATAASTDWQSDAEWQTDADFAAKPTALCSCSASADCAENPGVTCQDLTGPCTCSSVDRDCDVGERGYVICNGTITFCGTKCLPPSPPVCSDQGCVGRADPDGFCTAKCGSMCEGFCNTSLDRCTCPEEDP